MSEPLRHYADVLTYPVRTRQDTPVRITRNTNILVTVAVDVPTDGMYAIDWHYANGNGPVNTENKCAIRLLDVDGKTQGVSIFPHRGTGEWGNWGWSNSRHVRLTAGRHTVSLVFDNVVENMNITTNEALIDMLRMTRL